MTEMSQCPNCLNKKKNCSHKVKVAYIFHLNHELICFREYCIKAKKVLMKVQLFLFAVLEKTNHTKITLKQIL